MKSAYFIDTPLYGDLFLEEVLFSYDNIPIVFTCTNMYNIRCLCVCDDIIENQSWIITKITSKVLLDVLYDRISICKAFESSEDNTTIAERDNGLIKYISKPYQEIDPMELPDPDEKLEMQEELYSYITLIEFENLDLRLFIDFKEENHYSYTFKINSTTTVSTPPASFDKSEYIDEFNSSDNISISYQSTNDLALESIKSSKNALESDVILFNAA